MEGGGEERGVRREERSSPRTRMYNTHSLYSYYAYTHISLNGMEQYQTWLLESCSCYYFIFLFIFSKFYYLPQLNQALNEYLLSSLVTEGISWY